MEDLLLLLLEMFVEQFNFFLRMAFRNLDGALRALFFLYLLSLSVENLSAFECVKFVPVQCIYCQDILLIL